MKAAVVIFPGSNREADVCTALRCVTGHEPEKVWHAEGSLPDGLDLIVLPGGFAHGDYLRCGAIAAHSPIVREIRARAEQGLPVLGICNGFQVLTEAGMLPGALLPNRNLKFICRDVHLRVENNQTIYTCGYDAGQTIRVPIAHHDGNYTADPDTLDQLETQGLIAFRYSDPEGKLSDSENYNGSIHAIAGVLNRSKTVLGLMPHPENAIDPLLGSSDGKAFFEGLVGALS
jgi:phosphoribosylformylglycinamidine synthase I